jgi:hypothetical protein
MPALNIVNGLTSLAFGFTVFSEVPRHTPLFLAIEVGALGCMAAGLWMLVKLEEAHQDRITTASPRAPDRSGSGGSAPLPD